MKSVNNFFALMLCAVFALSLIGCENVNNEVDTTKPTIGIETPSLNSDEMVTEIMIIPSTDATAWYWKIEAAGESLEYQQVDGAAGAIITGKVKYGIEYTVSAYAVKGDIVGDTATKKFCFMPEEAADIIIGDATLDKESMTVSCTMYPSSMTEKWYWRAYNKTDKNTPAWTEMQGNEAENVSFAYVYGATYNLEAYAEHVGGKSETRSIEVYFEPEAATIAVSEPVFNEDTMTVSFDVTPSESTDHWFWGIYKEGEDTNYETYKSNEPKSVSIAVEYDVEYTFIFRAENVVNKGEEKFVTFKRDMPILEPLVNIAIENLTAYTLDAVITKADHCVKYVAGARQSDSYDRDTFVEQALSSLNPDPSYPFMAFNTATESRTFSEQDLVRNSKADSNENAGIILIPGVSYTIAVYGEDKNGRWDVYTSEVIIPEAEINGNIGVEISIDEAGETSATLTVSATENCKVLTGYMDYSSNADDLSYDFATMTEEEICSYIASTRIGVPTVYTAPVTIYAEQLALDTRYMAYAIAIKDGKVGNIAIKEFKTKSALLTGKSKIIAAKIAEQTSHSNLNITLTADNNAKKIRLYAAPEKDHSAYAENMEFVMGSDTYQNYREEYEYTAGEPLSIVVNIYHPGDNYYLYAVAVDSDGKAGDIVNVTQLAGLDTEYIKTKEEIINSNISLTGTGEVALTAEILVDREDQIDANITVEFLTDNIEKVWLYRINEGKKDKIRSCILRDFADYPNIVGAKQEVNDGDTKNYQYMLPYTSDYGGSIIVAVVLDTDGLFNISSYFVAGEGVKIF